MYAQKNYLKRKTSMEFDLFSYYHLQLFPRSTESLHIASQLQQNYVIIFLSMYLYTYILRKTSEKFSHV